MKHRTAGTPADLDLKAKAIAASRFMSDKDAAARYKIGQSTLRGWRAAARDDPELSELIEQYCHELGEPWRVALGSAMLANIEALERAAQRADLMDPNVIAALSKALATLHEVKGAWFVLDKQSVADSAPSLQVVR